MRWLPLAILAVLLPATAAYAHVDIKPPRAPAGEEIVRWLGPEGTSASAPKLRLTAAREPAPELAQSQPEPQARPEPQGSEDGGGDNGGDVPIWAGVGLIVLSAVAGSALARRRNRRRLEGHK